MPEESINIYMSLVDKVTGPLSGIGTKTKAFSKELQELEQTTQAYSKIQDKLSKETVDYRKKLEQSSMTVREARKAFAKYKDEAHKGALDKALEEQEEYRRRLKETETAMKSNYGALKSLMDQQRKAENQGGSGSASLWNQLGNSGILKMYSASVSGMASAVLSSAIGEPGARLLSSIAGGALEGASAGVLMGSVLGIPGVAVGALAGGASGLISGWTEIFKAEDDAFKSYYGGLYSSAVERRSAELEEGSSIAGSRESTRLAFNKLLGGETEASEYLKRVEALAVDTNYGYDEITGYTKLLLNNFQPDQVLDILMDLSDATAGLSLSSADVAQFISGLNRMTTAGKATREWLSYFDDRGLNTSDALASYLHVDKSRIADMVTGGEVTGEQAVAAIRAYIQREYGGLSAELAGSYDAMKDNLEDAMDGIGAALGAAFNEKNKEGVGADLAAYGDTEEGGLGAALVEMNGMIGEGMAIADNLSRQYQREAMNALLLGDETTVYGEEQDTALQEMHGRYAALKSEWDDLDEKLAGENLTEEARRTYEERQGVIGKELEALKGEAESLAEAAYDAGDLSQTVKDVELELISAIRENTLALGEAAYLGDYEKQQELSVGTGGAYIDSLDLQEQAAGIRQSVDHFTGPGYNGPFDVDPANWSPHAWGLGYVPYDNFPALLHQGERVLTASQARAADQGAGPRVQVTVTGNSFYGSDKDLEDRVARRVASEVVRAVELGV